VDECKPLLAGVVFVGYAVMGHLLFGSQIESFATMSDAMQTNFEMLLGEVTVSNEMLAGAYTRPLFGST